MQKLDTEMGTQIENEVAPLTAPSIMTTPSTSTSSTSSALFSCSTASTVATSSSSVWEPVNDLFQISTERVQVCDKCNKVTTRDDREFDLTVQIDTANPGLVRDLEWGITDTMKQEVTTEDNKRFCERCKSNEHAHISNFFTSLPKIMILRLQRSNFMQGAVKIPNGVACSQRMNFRQWMSSTYQGDNPDYGERRFLCILFCCMVLCVSMDLINHLSMYLTYYRTMRYYCTSWSGNLCWTLFCLHQKRC